MANSPPVVPLGDNDPTDDVMECNSHGTHVAGTIGAVGNNQLGVVGVNWQCDILPLKVGAREMEKGEWDCAIVNTVEALEYALLMGARASNNSYGGPSFQMSMYLMIQLGAERNHVFVAAAGNSGDDYVGDDNDQNPHYPSGYDLPNVIAVAAIDIDDRLAGFSNFGMVSVDLGAPGVGVASTVQTDRYAEFEGTSMASPHVAGAVLLLSSSYAGESFRQWKSRVLDAVRPLPALAGRTVTGGTLRIDHALGNWVDFDWMGEQTGATATPFSTLDGALLRTPHGHALYASPGQTGWTGTIASPVRIHAEGGSVFVGK